MLGRLLQLATRMTRLMHDAYQKDDIYNEAARRVGAGDIVLGKRTIRKNIEFTLNEIRKIKIRSIATSSIFLFLSACYFWGYILHTYTNGKNFDPHIWRSIIPFSFLLLAIVAFNLGRCVQYVPVFSRLFLRDDRKIHPEIEGLFNDLRNGSWEASIGGKQMPSYLLDSPWRMLLVGGADVRERRHELWCLFKPKLAGDICVRKIPSGQHPTDRPDIALIHVQSGRQETTEIALEDAAREGHGTPSNTDTPREPPAAYTAEVIQGSHSVTREGRLLEEFRSIFPTQFKDLLEFLQDLQLERKLKRSHQWPGENSEKWLIIFQTCHEVAKTTGNVESTGKRLVAECVTALEKAKDENRINEVGLTTHSPSTDWVKGFVHNGKGYGWIYDGIFEFNSFNEIK
ncbi:hypothetical protein [Gluconobacter sp.]|uniref:hypothetical protein n=1 Tax=Gluconobacter sp. TaxID=1876758 RepID=UPI0039E970FD